MRKCTFLFTELGERNENTESNHGHVEEDKRIISLQLWFKCLALVIHKHYHYVSLNSSMFLGVAFCMDMKNETY
jgi:hypothetical protein